MDGLSPLRKGFDPAAYALSLPIGVGGRPGAAARFKQLVESEGRSSWLPPVNYDPARLTTLAMTGVTALVRATAFAMEQTRHHLSGSGYRPLAAGSRPDPYQQRGALRPGLPLPQPSAGRCALLQRRPLYRPAGNDRHRYRRADRRSFPGLGRRGHATTPWICTTSTAGPITAAGRTWRKAARRCWSSITAIAWPSSAATPRAADLPRPAPGARAR